MSFLRRAVLRSLTASPSRIRAVTLRPHSFTTYSPSLLRPSTSQWLAVNSIQKRLFASGEDSMKTTPLEDGSLEAAPENAVAAENATAAAPAPSGSSPPPPSQSTVYVGNLFFETDEAKLRETFGPYGQINSLKVATDSRGLSRGFAFLEFDDPAAAKQAIMEKDQQVLMGRRMAVQIHTPRPRFNQQQRPKTNEPTRTLFIGNMSFEMSDRDLNELFRDIRNVLDVRVAIDRRSGQPRGFAHADFLDVNSAVEAAEILKNKVIYGRQLRVDFSAPSSQRQSAPE